MSEHTPKQAGETLKGFEELATSSEHLLPDAEHAEKLRAGEKDPVEALTEARKGVQETTRSERQVNPLDKLQEAEKAQQGPSPTHINRELKQVTLQRELTQIRRHLSAPERQLSKIIHQPVVRKVSEVSGKTVSRPSGMLGGGILAFLGSSSYLYLAKHQGFKYNYAVFLALFLGGFFVGVALELIVWTATHSRRHATD
jgi:hypothetical protein